MPTWLRIIKLYANWLLPPLLMVCATLSFIASVYYATHGQHTAAIYWLLFSWMTFYQAEHEI